MFGYRSCLSGRKRRSVCSSNESAWVPFKRYSLTTHSCSSRRKNKVSCFEEGPPSATVYSSGGCVLISICDVSHLDMWEGISKCDIYKYILKSRFLFGSNVLLPALFLGKRRAKSSSTRIALNQLIKKKASVFF